MKQDRRYALAVLVLKERIMRTRMVLAASVMAVCSLALSAQAAPPEGKGSDNRANNSGNPDKGGKGNPHAWDNSGKRNPGLGDLVYAGITAVLAREYALDFGLSGYSTLPPGIRKNLARGKPIPPGIAKKMVPSSLLGRLPRHPGYEWRVAGTDLILISVATAVVADILYDVFD